jgi:hypothetical protein
MDTLFNCVQSDDYNKTYSKELQKRKDNETKLSSGFTGAFLKKDSKIASIIKKK